MGYEEFIEKASRAGEFESEGDFFTDLAAMRRKLSEQLHGREGLWLISLLQSIADTDCRRVSIQTRPGHLQIVFNAVEYPTPGSLAPFLLGSATGSSAQQWCLLKGLLSLPARFRLAWHGPDGRLKREEEAWEFEARRQPKKKPDHRISILDSRGAYSWRKSLDEVRFRMPLPPYPLIWNTQRCWPELEVGGGTELLFYATVDGADLDVWACDTHGKMEALIRLGLSKKPFHRIVYLDRGARIHQQRLDFESYFLCTEVFVSGKGLPTDLGGFSLRQTAATEERLSQMKKRVFIHLRKSLSQLISHPRLPSRLEDQQRQETVVSSAVALGGLSFLHVPFFHPFLTLGLATLVVGGLGLNSIVKKRKAPWRGEYGQRRIRRDLVEVRKQIERELKLR